MYIDLPFLFLFISVDDQLDEDDLELIKENIGVDIQVVSTSIGPHTLVQWLSIILLPSDSSVLCRKNHAELGLRVMMKRRRRRRRRVRGGGKVGGEGVRVEDMKIRDLPLGMWSWIR